MHSDVSTLIAASPGRMRDSLYALLKAVSHIQVIGCADDGATALSLVTEHEPDLVLLDTNLAKAQVGSTLEQIKAMRPQTRCIVLVDSAQQRQLAETAGADATLIKGFRANKLVEVIERLASGQVNRLGVVLGDADQTIQEQSRRCSAAGGARVSAQDAISTGGGPSRGQRRILVVDDDPNMAKALSMILGLRGYVADTVYSSSEVQARTAGISYDCVLSDICMPGMNGVELHQAIKRERPDLPFVLVTAYASDSLVQRGLDEGVVAVLRKPVDMEELFDLLDRVCTERGGG